MKTILVKRKWLTAECTIGEMYVEGHNVPLCYTLEDVVRQAKVNGETAIPAGTYEVVIDFSTRFQRLMPHILDVPGFEGIRIHSGNTAGDTEGCILVGLDKTDNSITDSRKAFQHVFFWLQEALKEGDVQITIQ